MPEVLLRGESIGNIKAVLFDKDGTLINSEEHLKVLSRIRIEETLEIYKNNKSEKDIQTLRFLLEKTYGVNENNVNPSGIIAIGSRQDNLIATATVLCLFGEDWPSAIEKSTLIFNAADEKESKVTSFAGVPYHYEILNRLKFTKMKLPYMKTLTQAGGKLKPDLVRKFSIY